ncbi:MAG: hypothetical protein ABSG04_06970 [Verrucomicrobiota bacterium]|jgi:hypothetical protein
MLAATDTRQPRLVEAEIRAAHLAMFPEADPHFVRTIFDWAMECFEGRYQDYQAIDAIYHDLEHTLQGALCMAQLLSNRHGTAAEPRLTRRMFELGMLAILMHDTGYLKKRDDNEGTGAKYTLTHVDRSIQFAGELMRGHDYPPQDILAVQNMIRCTGVNVKLDSIQFQSDLERIVGFALGTSDLLGQMAAADYVDKLPILYSEFAEAARYNQGRMKAGGFFSSADDLMQKTPMFWEIYVRQKISREFLGLFKFLNVPYPDGRNAYLERIDANIARLRRQLGLPDKTA